MLIDPLFICLLCCLQMLQKSSLQGTIVITIGRSDTLRKQDLSNE